MESKGPIDIKEPQRERTITVRIKGKLLYVSSPTQATVDAEMSIPAILRRTIRSVRCGLSLLERYPPRIALGIPAKAKVMAPTPTSIGLNRHLSSSQGASQVKVPPIWNRVTNKMAERRRTGPFRMLAFDSPLTE